MQIFFIENLTLTTWLFAVWPYLRHKKKTLGQNKPHVYFVDGNDLAVNFARKMVSGLGVCIEQLKFGMHDIQDEKGKSVWMRIYFQDMAEVLERIVCNSVFNKFVQRMPGSVNFATYLRKRCLPGTHITDKAARRGLWRAIYVIQVCFWKMRQEGRSSNEAVVFLNRRVWLRSVTEYVNTFSQMVIVPVGSSVDLKTRITRSGRLIVGRRGRVLLEKVQRLKHGNFTVIAKRPTIDFSTLDKVPRVALEFYGHFNLNQPELQSDFFFWQQSSLPGQNLIAIFNIPKVPLDEKKQIEMSRHKIHAVALSHTATTLSADNIFTTTSEAQYTQVWRQAFSNIFLQTPEGKWLREEMFRFQNEKIYWKHLFETYNIKIYTTWYKYNANHSVIADAIQSVGGAMTIYQRSYEGLPSAQFTTSTDILFGFSKMGARVEELSNSHVMYYVTTGYLSDHRFQSVSTKALCIRNSLHQNGAKHIVAVFDENTADDGRWISGHEQSRADYSFWLEKVLQEHDLGLVLKPKTPSNLQQRLGPVIKTLVRAQNTGRCYLYEESAGLQSPVGPAQAALSADVAIHSSIFAATAAVEAALAGIPTLILDRDNLSDSPLYKLGVDRVVFKDWKTLWQACQDYWRYPGGISGFGDWSPILNELDPFRDGYAAKRMGTYLHWLIQGFEAGWSREKVLADVAERYCNIWGWDKVTEVKPKSPLLTHSQTI